MRITSLLVLGLGSIALAQTAAPTAPATIVETPITPPAAPSLTPEQVANVLKQLDEIERNVMAQRGTSLGSIIQKLHSAAGSDAAALNLITECDILVNVERKDGDTEDKRRIEDRKDNTKRNERDTEEMKKNGDPMTGLRLELEYLALTLEAHDVKDLSTMAGKIAAFHQSLLSQAASLKGATGESLMRPIGGGGGGRGGRGVGVVIEAYQLDPFVRREGWPLAPGDVISMYDRVLLQKARLKKKEDIGSLWDTALTLDASIRKERMFEKEFQLWQVNEYPDLKWRRATDLASNGPNPVQGMAEMLKVIKDYPNSPSSPDWIQELRDMVKPGTSAGAEPAPVGN